MPDDAMARQVKSFTSAAQRRGGGPVPFEMDGRVCYAAAVLPAAAITDLASLATEGDRDARVVAMSTFLDLVLLPESAEYLSARMRDAADPLALEDVADVVVWLVQEVYGHRPSVPSSPSAGG